MTSYYPVFLDIESKKCVVVGGGQVALRKVRALLERRAAVEVISPELCPELSELAENGKIRVVRREYQPGDLREALIVIAATDDSSINTAVAGEAKTRAVIVNVVDDPEHSVFIVPSCISRGDLTIAISTSGKSPALARKLRTRLEKELPEEYGALVLLVDGVREDLKRRKIKVSSETWQEALDIDLLLGLLKQGDPEKARYILLEKLRVKPS